MVKGTTIQDVIDSGDTYSVWCHNPACGHRGTLDFLKLRERFGPDHGAMHDELVPHIRCTKCNGKKGERVGITINQKSNDKYCQNNTVGWIKPPT